MSAFLDEILTIGFVDKLDGDDGRVAKMEKAAATVASELKADPPLLIGAVLAGLDPDVPGDDPAIQRAEKALVAEWRSLSSVFPDRPVHWYRAILLDACAAVGDGELAAVLWLSAADHLPLVRLGREEAAIRRLLANWAEACERRAMEGASPPAPKKAVTVKLSSAAARGEATNAAKVDRAALLQRVEAAVGPQNRQGQARPNPNPHWTNSAANWSYDFADRMAPLLADALDTVSADAAKRVSEALQQQATAQATLVSELQSALDSQRKWLEGAHQAALAQREVASTQLDALWWAEALYSPSIQMSYREVSPAVAAFLMAKDLCELMPSPAPASVGYLLAEAVGRIPGAGHGQPIRFTEVLRDLRSARKDLPAGLRSGTEGLEPLGRLGLRDLVALATGDRDFDAESELPRSLLRENPALTLPRFAHALFRQEQATELAGGRK